MFGFRLWFGELDRVVALLPTNRNDRAQGTRHGAEHRARHRHVGGDQIGLESDQHTDRRQHSERDNGPAESETAARCRHDLAGRDPVPALLSAASQHITEAHEGAHSRHDRDGVQADGNTHATEIGAVDVVAAFRNEEVNVPVDRDSLKGVLFRDPAVVLDIDVEEAVDELTLGFLVFRDDRDGYVLLGLSFFRGFPDRCHDRGHVQDAIAAGASAFAFGHEQRTGHRGRVLHDLGTDDSGRCGEQNNGDHGERQVKEIEETEGVLACV